MGNAEMRSNTSLRDLTKKENSLNLADKNDNILPKTARSSVVVDSVINFNVLNLLTFIIYLIYSKFNIKFRLLKEALLKR